jgi:hypothetical protein
MEVSLASPPPLKHIYLKLLVKLIVNHLVGNKKTALKSSSRLECTNCQPRHSRDVLPDTLVNLPRETTQAITE